MNVVILKNEQIEIIVFRSNICHKRIIRTMVHLKAWNILKNDKDVFI